MPWLILAYPLLSHLATLWHSQRLAALALAIFVAVPLLPALRRRRTWAWLALTVTLAVLYFAVEAGWAARLMYLPPVLIPLSVLALFARSLRPGQQPLVSVVARQIRGAELPPELATHTRRVTQCWVWLLAILALGALLLAIFASAEIWSLMTNVVMYLILGSAFVIEYGYRRWRYRHLQHEGFATLIATLVRQRRQR